MICENCGKDEATVFEFWEYSDENPEEIKKIHNFCSGWCFRIWTNHFEEEKKKEEHTAYIMESLEEDEEEKQK